LGKGFLERAPLYDETMQGVTLQIWDVPCVFSKNDGFFSKWQPFLVHEPDLLSGHFRNRFIAGTYHYFRPWKAYVREYPHKI
jgi:hypothetical protein